MLEEMHDPVLSQPISPVGSEPPLLSSEKKIVHGHFCYWYNVAQDPVVRSSIKFNHGLSVNQSFKS